MNTLSRLLVSVCAGAFITACSKEEPTTPMSAPTPSPEALAERQACQAAFDKTLYAVNPSDKSPEAIAARHAIHNTPEEGRMLLNGCRAEWQREVQDLAINTHKDRSFACAGVQDILIRIGQIEASGVPTNETNDLRVETADTFRKKCDGVRLPRR